MACIPGDAPWLTPSGMWRFWSSSSRPLDAHLPCPHWRQPMAQLRIPDENRTINDEAAVGKYLADRGIDYERWAPSRALPLGSPADAILDAYKGKIDELKAQGGYVTADVIDVHA